MTSEEEFINMIVSDARREFVGDVKPFLCINALKEPVGDGRV